MPSQTLRLMTVPTALRTAPIEETIAVPPRDGAGQPPRGVSSSPLGRVAKPLIPPADIATPAAAIGLPPNPHPPLALQIDLLPIDAPDADAKSSSAPTPAGSSTPAAVSPAGNRHG